MEEIGYAKINLALHVRKRELDGYHRLETLFAFAEEGDRLSVSEAETLSLAVTGPFAAGLSAGPDNLVLRAAETLRQTSGVKAGAALVLDKRLPIASGIGGGSADAAAALRLLCRHWQLGASEQDLLAIAAGLGADVPACVLSRTARGEGKGDRLIPLLAPELGGKPLLLVNPGAAVSTAAVFAAWDGIDRGPLGPGAAAAVGGRNDLEAAARRIAPEIADVLAVLAALDNVLVSRMSGSGATCFALFDTLGQRDQAQRRVAELRPHWWQLASRLR